MDVPEVQLSGCPPRRFWKNYVSQRQPVVIHGVSDNWSEFTDDMLVERAGDAVVMVEHRRGSSDAYGQGKKAPMAFRDFIRRMQQGDNSLYLSTQEVGVGRDGHPLLYGAPLVDLRGAFPLQQPLLPNLVPQSINMWMGCAPEGSSSGLHHDFHDNLYILLRGTKRFRLWPPSTAPNMYVAGSIRHIYPNGRIVYDGQGDIQPDGSNTHDVNVWRAHHAVDEAAAAAAAADGSDAAAEAEALLEQRLEAMLDEGGAHDSDSLMDDYVNSDTPGSTDTADNDTCSDGADQEDSDTAHKLQRQQRKQQGSRGGQPAGVPSVAQPPPPSFSGVQLDLPEAELQRRFPRFPGLSAASVVVLQAGDMLFLPAGWFHEVTSFGCKGLDGGHLAFNYWYHPPDNLDPGKAGFIKPYTSPYFPTLWANRSSWLERDTRVWWQQQQQQVQQRQQTEQQQQQRRRRHNGSRASHKKRRLQWAPSVADPGNVYEVFNTRPGTATGSFNVLPQHSGLPRSPSASSSEDPDDPAAACSPPDDDQRHHQLGKDVADGIEALEAYFGENPDAMQELLEQFLAERRARLASASRAHEETLPLPRLRGRRHHYTVVAKMTPRRPKPKPQRQG